VDVPAIGIGAGRGSKTRWRSVGSKACSKQHPSTQHSVTTVGGGTPSTGIGALGEDLRH
jgi:hypothetical protein